MVRQLCVHATSITCVSTKGGTSHYHTCGGAGMYLFLLLRCLGWCVSRVHPLSFTLLGIDPFHLVLLFSKAFRVISLELEVFLEARFAKQFAIQRCIIPGIDHLCALYTAKALLVPNFIVCRNLFQFVHGAPTLDTTTGLRRLPSSIGLFLGSCLAQFICPVRSNSCSRGATCR